MVLPPACQHQADGTPPAVSLQTFRGQARAHLLSVGIIRPAADVTAIDVNAFLSAPHGAPAGAGKVAEADKGDVARFLNRHALAPAATLPSWLPCLLNLSDWASTDRALCWSPKAAPSCTS